MEWQSIETAPKDGTYFIAWLPLGQRRTIVWWERESCWTWRDEKLGDNTVVRRRIVSDTSYWMSVDAEYPVQPSLWMPLPDKPKVS